MTWVEFENQISNEVINIFTSCNFINGDCSTKEELSKNRKTPFFRSTNFVAETQEKTCVVYDITRFNNGKWADNSPVAFPVLVDIDVVTPNPLNSEEFANIQNALEENFSSNDWELTLDGTDIDFDSKKNVAIFTARKVFTK